MRTLARLLPPLVVLGLALALVPPADAQKRGGTLTIVRPTDPVSLDPNLETTAPGAWVYFNMLEGLLTLDDKMQVKPLLATSYEVMSPTKVRFKLRPNVKFHDGTPFNAAAVKFTFDRIQEPLGAPGVARAFLGPYEGADVVDPQTVRIRLKQPYAPFLRMVALSPLAPLSPTAAQKMGQDFSRKPVGTGPFMVKEWIPKSHVTLVRNPDYAWPPSIAAHRGPAHLEEITWRFVLEATTRPAVLQTGEAQIAEDLSYADVAALEKNPDVRIVKGVPAGTPWTIFPNVQKFPTNDPAVRRALHHAINKDAIVRVVFHGQSQAAGSLIQPPTPGFVPVAKELFPYDPARAKKILDDAGWKPGGDGIRAKDGKRLEILWIFGTNNGYEEMAPLIQGMAREVGIDIQLREQPRVQM